jgi:hypothetical protein
MLIRNRAAVDQKSAPHAVITPPCPSAHKMHSLAASLISLCFLRCDAGVSADGTGGAPIAVSVKYAPRRLCT